MPSTYLFPGSRGWHWVLGTARHHDQGKEHREQLHQRNVRSFKFGGVEFFKIKAAGSMGEEAAWKNRNKIYLASAAGAEFIADVFLCPLEAARIRLVSNPTYASGTIGCMTKMASEMGVVPAFYSGFGPILMKQIPYTMAKFAVQGAAAEAIYNGMGKSPKISHPADTLLSKVNKAGAGGEGSIASRWVNIAKETGFKRVTITPGDMQLAIDCKPAEEPEGLVESTVVLEQAPEEILDSLIPLYWDSSHLGTRGPFISNHSV